eukprot:207805_1
MDIRKFFKPMKPTIVTAPKKQRKSNHPPLFSREKIQNIHINNKHLAFGYIRELSMYSSYQSTDSPQLINYLCLLFLNETEDTWDAKHTHKSIQISDNTIRRTTSHGYKSAFLQNWASSGIHIWRFKYFKVGYWDVIGIWKANKTPTLHRDLFGARDPAKPHSFGLICSSSKPRNNSDSDYCNVAIKPHDVIEMKLDVTSLTLSYSVNNAECNVKKIDNATYRAAVSLSNVDNSIQLLSYQRIYGNNNT